MNGSPYVRPPKRQLKPLADEPPTWLECVDRAIWGGVGSALAISVALVAAAYLIVRVVIWAAGL